MELGLGGRVKIVGFLFSRWLFGFRFRSNEFIIAPSSCVHFSYPTRSFLEPFESWRENLHVNDHIIIAVAFSGRSHFLHPSPVVNDDERTTNCIARSGLPRSVSFFFLQSGPWWNAGGRKLFHVLKVDCCLTNQVHLLSNVCLLLCHHNDLPLPLRLPKFIKHSCLLKILPDLIAGWYF